MVTEGVIEYKGPLQEISSKLKGFFRMIMILEFLLFLGDFGSSYNSTWHFAQGIFIVSLQASKSSSIELRTRTRRVKISRQPFYTGRKLLKILVKYGFMRNARFASTMSSRKNVKI